MKSVYFTPGPSEIYPSYAKHLGVAMELQYGSINHRGQVFRDIYRHTDEQLRMLLNIPDTHSIFFTSSATEIWERLILNLVPNESFHLVNGAFSRKFKDFSTALGRKASFYEVPEGQGFDIDAIQIPETCELICTTQNETSTGTKIAEDDLVRLKKKHPSCFICTDLVSSAPYSAIDYQFIDCSFFSVQKAFGMPPGLGVWIINKQCIEQSRHYANQGLRQGAHHTLASFELNYQKFETPSTPNIIAIYCLGKIAEDFNRIGITKIRQEISDKINLLYQGMAQHALFQPFVENTLHRSDTVAVFNSTEKTAEFIQRLKQTGYHIGSGYGPIKEYQIRIANFPATSMEQMEQLIHQIQTI